MRNLLDYVSKSEVERFPNENLRRNGSLPLSV